MLFVGSIGGRKRRILVILFIAECLILASCSSRHPYDYEDAERTAKEIPSDSYFMSDQYLSVLEKSAYEDAEVVYDAEDEWELARVIQYALEKGEATIAYQSGNTLDLDVTADILSALNPFDLSLTQNDTIYTNAHEDMLYTAHHVTVKNLDERYGEAESAASDRLKIIFQDHMSVRDKIIAIHNDIVKNSVYDSKEQYAQVPDAALYSAAGVLIEGKGVCTGYSRAFMIMARMAGIPAIFVASEEMNHGWNYVFDGDQWYYIDVTWDDPVPDQGIRVQNTYLLKNKKEFFHDGAHSLNEEEEKKIDHIINYFF